MTVAGLMGYLDSFSPQEELSIEIPDIFSQALVVNAGNVMTENAGEK